MAREMFEDKPDRPPTLRVLTVARQPIARAGLRGLLAEEDEAQIVGHATVPDEAARLARDLSTDLVLAAWDSADGEELAHLAATLDLERIPLVLLGDEPTSGELGSLLRAGVKGFLPFDVAAGSLVPALRAVAAGYVVLDPPLGRAVSAAAPLASLGGEEPLTEREREVLQLLATGLPNKTIASRMRISEHTVKFHVGSIMSKLHAASRTEAVTRAARQGLLAL